MAEAVKKKSLDDRFVEINEMKLDREWLEQPGLYLKYAIKLAEARNEFAEDKANLEVVKAILANKIRDDPTAFDIRKVTNETVENCIVVQNAYKRALKRMNDSKYKVDILQAAVEALEHKKKALENLVQLFSLSYFAVPRTNGRMTEEARQRMDRVDKRNIRRKGLSGR